MPEHNKFFSLIKNIGWIIFLYLIYIYIIFLYLILVHNDKKIFYNFL